MGESSFLIASNSNYTIFAEVHVVPKTDKFTPTGLGHIFTSTLTKQPTYSTLLEPVYLNFIYAGTNMAAFNVLRTIITEDDKKVLIIRQTEESERFDGEVCEVLFKYTIQIKSSLNTSAALKKLEEIRGVIVSRFCDFLNSVMK